MKGAAMETIIVTDWEEVQKDDFYLSKEWIENGGKDAIKAARKLQRKGNLFIAYEVPVKHYVLYQQMDAYQIFIDREGNRILECESAVIDNKHEQKFDGDN